MTIFQVVTALLSAVLVFKAVEIFQMALLSESRQKFTGMVIGIVAIIASVLICVICVFWVNNYVASMPAIRP
ncbi:MAG TPA: hypothetical protein VEF04_12235 [Blastocatellia bacterium]|nr:hypothetical protein [Blastocatellia bacterium]